MSDFHCSRRQFLKLLAALGAGAALGIPQHAACAASTGRPPVLVIGAGISGLAAAQALLARGHQVTVLEARNRIGGRIWSESLPNGATVDLGASWIHGLNNNPITGIAGTLGLPLLATNYDSSYEYTPFGEISDAASEAIEELYQAVISRQERLRRKRAQRPLRIDLNEIVASLGLDAQQREYLEYAMNTSIEHEYSGSLEALSNRYWDEGEELQGGDAIFPNGYSQVLSALSPGVDIRLDTPVEQIEYDGNGVRAYSRGAVFHARAALVTVPLGVLKQGVIAFAPALPAAKVAAIQTLGMGVLNKLVLSFPQASWPSDPQFFNFISGARGQWAEWMNMSRYTGHPVLVAFNAAGFGAALEGLSQEQAVQEAMTVARSMFGSSLPEPTHVLRTRWNADQFSYGSYSFLAAGSAPRTRDVLAKHVGKRLFFAGEATHKDYAATVHGAYLSGIREAKNIMKSVR